MQQRWEAWSMVCLPRLPCLARDKMGLTYTDTLDIHLPHGRQDRGRAFDSQLNDTGFNPQCRRPGERSLTSCCLMTYVGFTASKPGFGYKHPLRSRSGEDGKW